MNRREGKVGKSDLLISWLVHMAAGQPFLDFTPPRPLRVFYLQAEIQYHYLRERMKQITLPPKVLAGARDNLVATPKLNLLLDAEGSVRVAEAIRRSFPTEPVDIICIDPIRNLFDGGPEGGGENDNSAMMFFLKDRVEVLRDHINPDCGVILAHHTKKLSKQQVKDDPLLALSGASALRGFYTSGLILHRPDEETQRIRLDFGPAHGISGRFLSPWIPYAQFSGALRVHTPPSVGQQFTAMSPNGDFQQAVAVPLTHSNANPSPSTAVDQNVLSFGDVTVTLAEDSLEIAVGDVRFKVDGANVEITGGEVRHNGKNIGDSHIHSGVRSGPSVTGAPAN